MTKVKICGITNLEDARHALDCGANELGFNFYRGSKRYVSPQNAREIIDQLPITSGNVGVFVNEPIESLLDIVNFAGLDGVQLHGDEDFKYVDRLVSDKHIFVLKALKVSAGFAIEDAMDWTANYILLDGDSSAGHGGTGTKFDWKIAAEFAFFLPEVLYLAGGLTPDNVAEAIRTVRPYAVDVASGVESNPGRKDREKVEAFITAAKNAI